MDSLIHVSLWQRSPWTGVPSAPRTTSLALTSPTASKSLGWGARVWSDIAGPTRMSGAHVGLAYKTRWTRDLGLSFGLGLGWTQFALDGNKIELEQGGDPVLGDTYQSVGVPDASAGLLLSGGAFQLAVSAGQILGSSLPVTRAQIWIPGFSHICVHKCPTATAPEIGGWTPVLQYQHLRPIPAEWSAAMRVDHSRDVWAMAGYRSAGAAHFGAGVRVNNQLTFSYNRNWATGSVGPGSWAVATRWCSDSPCPVDDGS